MTFLIILAVILIIAIIVFAVWFAAMKADGKCPICALKHLGSSKLTVDIENEDDYDNGVSPSPLMGWSSWNTLRNHIDEDTIIETAKAMKETGLADAGYKYVNLDDCWHSSMRDKNGMLQGDLESFPSGIEGLCKRINALGLKTGIYSSNGTLTCEDLPASLGNELLDAKTFASWGIEYLKYDFCHNKKISGLSPMIEYLDINKPGERASIRLTPEKAAYTGMARTVKCNVPSGKAMAYLNHNAGTASFEFDAPVSGKYILTIHYHKAKLNSRQYLQVVINGTVYELFFPNGRSFTPDARLQAEIQLESGVNTLVLQNPIVTKADSAYTQYKRMSDALKTASYEWAKLTGGEIKPITFSICEWGFSRPYIWGAKAGNMWRTTPDIAPNWFSILHIYNHNIKLYKYARPGHTNDPDMLEVGNGKLTFEENRSHFTLWCMMAAPLVLGNDIRKLLDGTNDSKVILDIVTNKSLILIDQDPLMKPAKKIGKQGSVDILARPLNNGDTVVCFFNKSKKPKSVELNIDDLANEEYLSFEKAADYQIHNLWDNDYTHNDAISTNIPPHGVKVFRISQ